MGVILSKFRRAKPSLEDSLEKIDKELYEIRRFQIDTEVQQKQMIGRLSITAFIIYALGILAYYLFIRTDTFTWIQHGLSLLPFIVFPIIIWSLRRLFGWWYQRKIVMNKEKADSLRKEKERLLEEVMEKETFKVAKKILEKYAPSHLLPKYLADQQLQRSSPSTSSTPLTRGGPMELRRRTMAGVGTGGYPPGYRPPMGQMQFGGRPPVQFRPQQQMAIMGVPGTPRFRPTPGMSTIPTGYTPMRYMLPSAPSVPIMHNRKTGWLDKLVDYVVADGPTHRFALICRYCATHNGLATPDDFPYTGYRCIYCRQFNPPRQQRPSAATLPRNTVLIEEMDSTLRDSVCESGGEESETERFATTDRSGRVGDTITTAGGSVNVEDSECEPQVELGDSTSDGSTKSGGEEGKGDDDIPFVDEQDLDEDVSIVESGTVDADISRTDTGFGSSVVGKLEVNIREQNAPDIREQNAPEAEAVDHGEIGELASTSTEEGISSNYSNNLDAGAN